MVAGSHFQGHFLEKRAQLQIVKLEEKVEKGSENVFATQSTSQASQFTLHDDFAIPLPSAFVGEMALTIT